MKANRLLSLIFFSSATVAASAGPTLVVGTPANSLLATPTSALPAIGNDISFDELTPGAFNASTYAAQGVTISSPDGLSVVPYSTQSAPNELFDNGAGGSADLTIKLAGGVTALGVGIADSDGVPITLEALNAAGTPFASFKVSIDDSGVNPNPGNGYFAIEDSVSDIFGLTILQPVQNANFSGLAIDDVQYSPEPRTLALFACGLIVAGVQAQRALRKRA